MVLQEGVAPSPSFSSQVLFVELYLNVALSTTPLALCLSIIISTSSVMKFPMGVLTSTSKSDVSVPSSSTSISLGKDPPSNFLNWKSANTISLKDKLLLDSAPNPFLLPSCGDTCTNKYVFKLVELGGISTSFHLTDTILLESSLL
ncbi:hypothetical protein D3C86_1523100 [compost metagenome]